MVRTILFNFRLSSCINVLLAVPSDVIQGVRTGSREPVLGISARLANPLLTLRNLCISISLYNEEICFQWWILGQANEADVCSECKERF